MRAIIPVLALALCAPMMGAQEPPRWKPELRPFIGTSMPTGGLRDVIGDQSIYGLAGAGELRPWLTVVGTFAWGPGTTHYPVTESGMDVLRYDMGLEVNTSQPIWLGLDLHAFWGIGAGARTYLYDDASLGDRTGPAGYLNTGVDMQKGRIGARLEARGNLFRYRSPLAGEYSATLHTLDLTLGFAYHLR